MQNNVSEPRRNFFVVALCFLLSGFAALLYEIVWMRQFAILFGTSEQALAVVLGSYMGGLALGSMIASRLIDRVRRPLWLYGVLEMGIAVCALLMPFGLDLVRLVQVSMFGGLPEPPAAGGLRETAFYITAAFGLLMPPTAMMGATLPLLSRHVVRDDREIGPRIGLLYAINTAGAVIGTLIAAFVCLPNLGLSKTIWVGALTNAIVFGLIALIAGAEGSRSSEPAKKDTSVRSSGAQSAKSYWWILPIVFISGAISFGYEIVFTRMLGHLVGGSIFAFATMLSSFLIGISLGGAIGSRLAKSRRAAIAAFIHAQATTAMLSLIAFHLLEQLAGWRIARIRDDDFTTLPGIVSSMLILLPPAISIGATFPFAIRTLARSADEAGSAAARVYAWNTAGGIAGALLTGMLVLPAFHYHLGTVLFVSMNLGLAVLTFLFSQSRLSRLGSAVCGAGLLALLFPGEAVNTLRVSPYLGFVHVGELEYTHAGRSATVSLYSSLGYHAIQTNGLPEAQAPPRGAPAQFLKPEVWLGALPTLIRPETESMLIVGLGGGVAANHVPPTVDDVDVFELEPAVLEANKRIIEFRDASPLEDPRVSIILNDARGGLALTTKRYDAIVSQPSHPWTAGASHLYTKDFMETARSHLNDGGVFLQWMSGDFVDEELVRSLVATLLDTFEYVRLYEPTATSMLFLASDQNVSMEGFQADPGGWIAEANASFYRRLGVVGPDDLAAMLTLDRLGLRELAGDAEITTDENNLMALRTADIASEIENVGIRLDRIFCELAPLSRSDTPPEFANVDRSAVARRRMVMLRKDSAAAVADAIEDPDERDLTNAWIAISNGDLPSAHELIDAVRQRSPSHRGAIGMLFQLATIDPSYTIPPKQVETLRERLEEQDLVVVDGVRALMEGAAHRIEANERKLAAIPRGDLQFQTAVSLRVAWRLSSTSRQKKLAEEALELIDTAMPITGIGQMALDRTIAGVKTGSYDTAFSSAQGLAGEIRRLKTSKDPTIAVAAVKFVPMLHRCLDAIAAMTEEYEVDPKRLSEVQSGLLDVLLKVNAPPGE